jgi:TonB family protein
VTLSIMPSPARELSLVLPVLAILACTRQENDGTMKLSNRATTSIPAVPAEEPPVAVNPISPVRYPAALLERGIEGRVLLRLYVDDSGRVVPDSTRIAESSGYPALDSAALAGAPKLKFSPALHQGQPTPALFLQPVQFRSPHSRTTTE